MKRAGRLVAVVTAAVATAGCTVGPNYAPPSTAALAVPQRYHYSDRAAAPQSPVELANWWQQFNDPALSALIDQAISRNLDIAVAVSRLRQAREGVVQARAERLPTVTGSAGAGRNFNFDGNDTGSFNVGGNAAWEVDLFGGISRNIEAARADASGAGYDLGAVRIAIIADVATNYIQARLSQQRLGNARETLSIVDENLQIASWRVQAGLVSSLDSEQARSQRAQVAATIPTLESGFAAAANRLAVLTGQAPGAFAVMLEQAKPIPTPPQNVALGIPADTLRRRRAGILCRGTRERSQRRGVSKAWPCPGRGCARHARTAAAPSRKPGRSGSGAARWAATRRRG